MGADFDKYRPWIICIESTIPNTKTQVYTQWENILLKNRYTYVLQHDVNRYYVAQEKENSIKNRFKNVTDLLREYDLTRYSNNKSYEKIADTIEHIKASKLLSPIRIMYNFGKNIKERDNVK